MQAPTSGISSPRNLIGWPAIVIVISVVTAVQAPFLAEPFGMAETNGGSYFGPFAVMWDQYGFAPTRGIPVWGYRYQALESGVAYVNHPPGFAWLSGIGVKEWQVRLPSILGLLLSSALMAVLVHRDFGRRLAVAGGILLGLVPCTAVASRSSYEPTVMAMGLAVMVIVRHLADDADTTRRGWWRLGLAGSTVVGVWLDWPFAFWIAATACLLRRRNWREIVLWCWLPAGLSAAILFGWEFWARNAPALQGIAIPSFVDVFRATRTASPPPSDLAAGVLQQWRLGFGVPVLVLAALGFPILIRRHRRLALATLIAGLPWIVVFARHSSTHIMFHAYLTPTLVAAVLALVVACRGHVVARGLAWAALIGAMGYAGVTTVTILRAGSDPLMRDIGRALDSASARLRPDGTLDRLYRVQYNLPYSYAYYIQSPLTEPRVWDPAVVQRAAAAKEPVGLRVLVFRIHVTPDDSSLAAQFQADAGLWTYLAQFPSKSHPECVRSVPVPFSDTWIHVDECREFTVRE